MDRYELPDISCIKTGNINADVFLLDMKRNIEDFITSQEKCIDTRYLWRMYQTLYFWSNCIKELHDDRVERSWDLWANMQPPNLC